MRAVTTGLAFIVLLAGCATGVPGGAPETQPSPAAATPAQLAARAQVESFISVIERVEPVAEAICRERAPATKCDLQIVVDDRPDQPPNAFQTVDTRGRPVVGFTLALIAEARNADEFAFVLGHEAAHHIAGHLPRREATALRTAVLAGVLAEASGATAADIQAAQEIGAAVGARSYSRQFELEADALGAEISLRAGFDPLVGAAFFDRLPDPGDRFMGTHPPNAERRAVVRQTVRRLTGA
jgi:predicted Zn-dependent protease